MMATNEIKIHLVIKIVLDQLVETVALITRLVFFPPDFLMRFDLINGYF